MSMSNINTAAESNALGQAGGCVQSWEETLTLRPVFLFHLLLQK